MPVSTPHFGLQAFVRGDYYSSSIDRKRFSLIDNHLAFLSDLIGDGIITGWELSDNDNLVLRCSPGMGLIQRFATRTFGYYEESLANNNEYYVWMKKRNNIVGSLGPFSDITSYEYSDITPPAQISSISVLSYTTESASLSWSSSSENDFYYYEIYLSKNNIDYDLLDSSSVNSYIITDLEQDTIYYVKIKSVDKSGNKSSFSSYVSFVTEKDLSVPGDPSNVRILNNDSLVQVLWRESQSSNVDLYRFYCYLLDSDGSTIGDALIYEADNSKNYIHLYNLVNGYRYKIVCKSVSVNDIESNGITVFGNPESYTGPMEVDDLSVTDSYVENGLSNNKLIVSWNPHIDPYDNNPASYFEVQIQQIDEFSIIYSEWIEVRDVYSLELQVFSFIKNNVLQYVSIKPETKYYVLVRAVDNDGYKSPGLISFYKTRKFNSVSPPDSLSVTQQKDQSLLFLWKNTDKSISYNSLNVYYSNAIDGTIYITEEEDVGKSEKYIIDKEFIFPDTTYTFVLKTYDYYGNQSEDSSYTYSIVSASDMEKPIVPKKQTAYAGNKQVIIKWDDSESDFIIGYNIWRSEKKGFYNYSDFSLLESVYVSEENIFNNQYIDFEVENDVTYVYFVTSIDGYGNESLNPLTDNYINYKLSIATPRSSSFLTEPLNIDMQISGSDITISWDANVDQFDGYEIWRSVGNKYSFEKIDVLSFDQTSFTDIDALVSSGSYYYLIRKFYNESDMIVLESNDSLEDAVFLGKVTTENDEINVDTSDIIDLSGFEDPIRIKTREKIDIHKHSYINDNDDRRINLSNSNKISSFTTSDYQVYTTDEDFSYVSSIDDIVVYINGYVTDLLYDISIENSSIVFEKKLYKGNFDFGSQNEYPFDTEPLVSIVVYNSSETQNALEQDRIESISAQQSYSGVIDVKQMPDINHEGRIKEKLVPKQESLYSIDDGFRFQTLTPSEIGDAVVFYDIIQSPDENYLIAATSDGLYISEDYGLHWVLKYKFIVPIIKLYYSESVDYYFALSNRGIFGSRGGSVAAFGSWTEMSGTENTKIIRDITETPSGKIFITSDIGIFSLEYSEFDNSFFWKQENVLGPESTDFYSIIYDDVRNRLIVSNEIGLFESSNDGISWSFIDDITEQYPAYCLYKTNRYIYAVTDFYVWRMGPEDSGFSKISYLENDVIRKMLVKNDRIYLSTSDGLLISIADFDIYRDFNISFDYAFSQLKINKKNIPATSLNLINNDLFIGSECRLYVSKNRNIISLHCFFKNVKIPTIYVNDKEYFIGYYFCTGNNGYVCFDKKISISSLVTFTNQYQNYKAVNGGWADCNFKAAVSLYLNGNLINDFSLAELPYNGFSNILFPDYNDRTSYKIGADYAKTLMQNQISNLLTYKEGTSKEILLTGFTRRNVANTLFSIEYFVSQIYKKYRKITIIDDNGISTEKDFSIPDFRVALMSCDFKQKFSSYGKYINFESDKTPGSLNNGIEFYNNATENEPDDDRGYVSGIEVLFDLNQIPPSDSGGGSGGSNGSGGSGGSGGDSGGGSGDSGGDKSEGESSGSAGSSTSGSAGSSSFGGIGN